MHLRGLATRNLVSPYGMVAASTFIFLIAYLFPPSLYLRYLSEPDFLFLDPTSLLFFLLCALGFVLGLLLVDALFGTPGYAHIKRQIRFSPIWFILLPVIAATGLTVLSSIVLVRDNEFLLQFLLAAQADQLKSDVGIQVIGPLGQAVPSLMGIVWWAIWRKHDLSLSTRQMFVINTFLVLAIVSLILSSILMVARGQMMPILAGIAIIILASRLKEGKLANVTAFIFLLLFVGSVIAIFMAFSLLRGQSDLNSLIASLLGYTIASYNRLAALLAGKFHYPFSGEGLYISSFIAFNKSFNALFHFNRIFDWPDFDIVWRSEFDAISAAGLNGRLIWSGTFGYLFSDLGWLSPFLLFVYGLFTGWTWQLLRNGKVAGIVLYPWCAFCTLYWFGTNFLLDSIGVDLLIVSIALGCYESLFSRIRTEA